jgi:hypothetical protein
MLRRRETPAQQLDGIRDELSRRYDAELTGFVPPATPGPAGPPPSPGWAPPASDDRSGWGGAPGPGGGWPAAQPPPREPIREKPGSGFGRAVVRLVVAVVVALVALGAYAAYEASQEPSAPTGSVCVTFRGTCPLSQALPVGSSCFCTDGVTQDPGTVQ